jgi:hypothetical protein
MASKGFSADRDGLGRLVSTIHNGADDLGEAAVPVSGAPDAGRSSANVGAALASITKSTASLIALSQDSANKININSGAYGATDNQADTGLRGVLGQLTSPN